LLVLMASTDEALVRIAGATMSENAAKGFAGSIHAILAVGATPAVASVHTRRSSNSVTSGRTLKRTDSR
jgi:hypothetical protein